MLPILLGQVGLPGSNPGDAEGNSSLPAVYLPIGKNPVKATIPVFMWTDAIVRGKDMTDITDGIRGVKKLDHNIKMIVNSGGKTCAEACKDAHNLPVGMNFRKVHEYAGGNWKQAADGSWAQDVFGYYVSLGCNHCSDPACVKVCPTKAHHKRAEDGLVVIDATKCIGCGLCAQACPYHAPVLDETAHKMRKCDACLDRLQRGLQPICVESCPNRAIEFGDIEELRKKHGKLAEVAPLPQASKTQPNLVLVVPAQARPAGDTSGVEY